ncbi:MULTISPECIES: ATP-dependent helicase [Alteromonadales]|jgi:superfamily I DNA/RNA helicase|uniref:ATP-dependent helicase n=1 Tax=Alteromonadales TaxID=135622 RepID=UPI002097A6F0|nr:ATP-dependent helicase [Pseudoalteromonas sp. Ps84H-4]MCO7248815.1 ATP-dependent helicase [Pseudoalteromonas sp. Ps84H-4]|tara:strand:- start:3577 stop:5322 length:1746 start_codon:yes stop_codon:yes gene_type:complete
MKLSDEQHKVVFSPLKPLSVIACAGSGKTTTAVHRLSHVRHSLNNERGYIALLSFSNVAVNTFKRDFLRHTSNQTNKHVYSDRVVIETLDSFIVGNVIRPHGSRVMGCSGVPFLLSGGELFLKNRNFNFEIETQTGRKTIGSDKVVELTCRVVDSSVECFLNKNKVAEGRDLILTLGKTGGYTHEFGGYWACKILKEQKSLAKAIAKRYPHIIVDEAQDIGSMHAYFLSMLIKGGTKLSLIGDPNQAIYEFAGADGTFLNTHNNKPSTLKCPLSLNRRSIKDIVDAASLVSGFQNQHIRSKENNDFGLFYCTYKEKNYTEVIDSFLSRLKDLSINKNKSAILVRGSELKKTLLGSNGKSGQGKTNIFAQAAIKRDLYGHPFEAFKLVLRCIANLIEDAPKEFFSDVLSAAKDKREYSESKKVIWQFVRSESAGLPSAKLHAKKEWHPKLKENLAKVLKKICELHGFNNVSKLGNKLASTNLPDSALLPSEYAKSDDDGRRLIRIDTVHQLKGETLDAVMYIANNDQVVKMAEGTSTELGRIGYVALTRARDFFVLAIPHSKEPKLSKLLTPMGFKKLTSSD